MKEALQVGNGYTAPYVTCILLLLYWMSQPRWVHPDMEWFFGMQQANIGFCVSYILNVLYDLALPYFSQQRIWLPRMAHYKKELPWWDWYWKMCRGLLMGCCKKHAIQVTFKDWLTVGINGHMDLSSNLWLHPMDILPFFLFQLMGITMTPSCCSKASS